jgi:hypothetical protein
MNLARHANFQKRKGNSGCDRYPDKDVTVLCNGLPIFTSTSGQLLRVFLYLGGIFLFHFSCFPFHSGQYECVCVHQCVDYSK